MTAFERLAATGHDLAVTRRIWAPRGEVVSNSEWQLAADCIAFVEELAEKHTASTRDHDCDPYVCCAADNAVAYADKEPHRPTPALAALAARIKDCDDT